MGEVSFSLAENLLLSTISCLHEHVGELWLIGVALEDSTERSECTSTTPRQQFNQLRQSFRRHLLGDLEAECAREDAFSDESSQDAGDVQRRARSAK